MHQFLVLQKSVQDCSYWNSSVRDCNFMRYSDCDRALLLSLGTDYSQDLSQIPGDGKIKEKKKSCSHFYFLTIFLDKKFGSSQKSSDDYKINLRDKGDLYAAALKIESRNFTKAMIFDTYDLNIKLKGYNGHR